MKIDTDLRNAIRSAEKAQPNHDYRDERKAEQIAITALLGGNRKACRDVQKSVRTIVDGEKAAAIAREKLRGYGLQYSGNRDNKLDIEYGDEGKKRFAKAGGKIPVANTRWKFDGVMAQLAAATPKEGAALLKKLGINWQ